MKWKLIASALTIGLLLNTTMTVHAETAEEKTPSDRTGTSYHLSGNIPLDSYVYTYLDKLDGLGYLRQVQSGTKPYTRMQVATWVQQMEPTMLADKNLAPFSKAMLLELKKEFENELAVLNGSGKAAGFSLRQIKFSENYYHGDTLSQNRTKSTYQPLNTNNNGYRYASGANETLSFQLEGELSPRLFFSITPRIDYNSTDNESSSLESGYIKTNIRNLSIQVGKDANSWGQGARSHLMYSNNAEPFTSIKLSNIKPQRPGGFLKFLGEQNTSLTYAVMEENRTDVPYPSFVAFRTDFKPTNDFTFALSFASMMGGKGHSLSGREYYEWILGRNNGNWSASKIDKWNTQSGLDFRWRLPHLNGIQVYGEIYGEDQHRKIIPYPYRVAQIFGVYIPRLTSDGAWDATLEYHTTGAAWYSHSTYTNGWVFKGDILGDAIGHNAKSYYGKITHYTSNGSNISLNLEQVKMEATTTSPQKVNSLWMTYHTKLKQDLFLDFSAGVADIDNFNFISGENKRNCKVGFALTQRY